MVFSTDRDIVKYEPVLFSEIIIPTQVLVKGDNGQLDGTTFTVEGADFEALNIEYGNVIYLCSVDQGVEGVYEIVSVDSSSQLCISVLRADEEMDPVGAGNANNIFFRICSYKHQANIVMLELTRRFGIKPGCPSSVFSVNDIYDTKVLREASIYAVISSVYAACATELENGELLWKKSLHYRKLFEEARESVRLSLDIGGDGNIEEYRLGGSFKVVRD